MCGDFTRHHFQGIFTKGSPISVTVGRCSAGAGGGVVEYNAEECTDGIIIFILLRIPINKLRAGTKIFASSQILV